MAIKELFSLVQSTMEISRSDSNIIHAGMAVARDSDGTAIGADRVTHTAFVGIAADDAARTGNTFIQSDPVGATKVSADGTTFTANNNAFFVSTKRALGDYQDETVSNVSDLTSGSTGYQGPRRGIGVYNYTPGTQFIIDGSVCLLGAKCASSSTDGNGTTKSPWAINDLLTTAVEASAGKWIVVDNTSYGTAYARIDKVQGAGTTSDTNTLIWITLV